MRMMKSSSSFVKGAVQIGRRASWITSAIVIGLVARVSAQSQGGHPDVDGDGLVFAQEHVLGTSPTNSDTDHDGYSDLEEIARHSSPINALIRPDLSKRLGVGMAAHAQADGVHVLVSVFMSDMNLRAKQLEIGLYGHNQMLPLSNTYLAQHATLTYHAASLASGCVALIDVVLDPNIVHSAGHLTVWARAGVAGAGSATSAATLHLLSIAGIVVWAMPVQRPGATEMKDGSDTVYVPLLPAPSGGGSGGNGSGSGGGGAPGTWEPGQVCFQHSTTVGADGASTVNEVVSAACVAGWDGFCPPGCSGSVGSTFRTVDPLVLIGG
jgi:hypothetical protein